MGEIRHIAFRAGAERERDAEKYEKAYKRAGARGHPQNVRH
jgi:hypothetical protein